MTGVCAMCHKKFENLGIFSEYRGNCRYDTLVCYECIKKRASNGGTCKSCVHFDPTRGQTRDGGCEKYRRYVGIADRCGQYEVKE